jgi:chromosome partitioning protein
MILLFGGEKGGTGKSTLATNVCALLARRGVDVLLVDTDRQGSGSSWAATRNTNSLLPPVHCVEKSGDVASAVRDLSSRYAQIVIDAGGRDSRELRSSMLVADKLFTPIKASQFDLWTVEKMNELVNQARGFNQNLEAHAIISMAPSHPQVREAEDAQKMLSDFEHLALAHSIVRDRKVFRDAILQGQGVVEADNRKATSEIEALAREIFNGSV